MMLQPGRRCRRQGVYNQTREACADRLARDLLPPTVGGGDGFFRTNQGSTIYTSTMATVRSRRVSRAL